MQWRWQWEGSGRHKWWERWVASPSLPPYKHHHPLKQTTILILMLSSDLYKSTWTHDEAGRLPFWIDQFRMLYGLSDIQNLTQQSYLHIKTTPNKVKTTVIYLPSQTNERNYNIAKHDLNYQLSSWYLFSDAGSNCFKYHVSGLMRGNMRSFPVVGSCLFRWKMGLIAYRIILWTGFRISYSGLHMVVADI